MMKKRTVYLDNAATTYPKPETVIRAVSSAMRKCGGNPGRGSHRLSSDAERLVYDCRCAAAELFGAEPERVIFTVNATHALNIAVKGLTEPGSHILIDNFAHNAALRPAAALADYDVYDASGTEENVIASLREKLRPETRTVIVTHHSNICSRILPAEAIGRFCAERGLICIVDASQSAGHLPLSLNELHASALCMPGHKGLYGPMGTGLLIAAPGLRFRTLTEGGTGIRSLDTAMPEELPERLEAGTLPLPAIAGLLEGIRFVMRTGTEEIFRHECTLGAMLSDGLRGMPGVTVYGEDGGAVIGFTVNGRSPAETGAGLAADGICVRTGYHCAPLAHRTVGSFENGSVRAGVSYFNSAADVHVLLRSLKKRSL